MAKQRPTALLVDDEPLLLEGLALHLRRTCEVVTAGSGAEGLARLRKGGRFAVVVSDIQMPAMHGVSFLTRAKDAAPDTTRIVLTGQTEARTVIEAINEAEVFRYLTKPCSPTALVEAVKAGIDHHRRGVEGRETSSAALRGSIRILTNLLSLTNPIAFGRANRLRELALAVGERLEVDDPWTLEISAMLSQLGAITLPPATAEKLYFARELSAGERPLVEALPETTVSLIADIPQLAGVRAILRSQNEHHDGSGPLGQKGTAIPLGARILKLALDYDRLETLQVEAVSRMRTLQSQSARYDPEVLHALAEVLSADDVRTRPREIAVSELAAGMILAGDIATTQGQLLLSRGLEISREALLRLGHFPRGTIHEPIKVLG